MFPNVHKTVIKLYRRQQSTPTKNNTHITVLVTIRLQLIWIQRGNGQFQINILFFSF